MNLLVMSDIHGNQSALLSVLDKVNTEYKIDACILLGDIIDYGMHSNEVIDILKQLSYPVLCNIRGNHEDAVVNEEYKRFSSERGRQCSKFTRSILTQNSWNYISQQMSDKGLFEFECAGKKCLAVHGSMEDEFWISLKPEEELTAYQKFDYVFSGHSHIPHYIEKYYSINNKNTRNKKKVIFINPGSVGQPRNLNPMAQYAVLDMKTEKVILDKAAYDILEEQSAYKGQVDEFYKNRLEMGI